MNNMKSLISRVLFLSLLLFLSLGGCNFEKKNTLVQIAPSKWKYISSDGFSINIEVNLFEQSDGFEKYWKKLVDFYWDDLKYQENQIDNTPYEKIRISSEEIAKNDRLELKILESNWKHWSYISIYESWLTGGKQEKLLAMCRNDNQPYDIIFTFHSNNRLTKNQAYEVLRKITLQMDNFSELDWHELPYVEEILFDDEGNVFTEHFEKFLERQ
ncbi:MAG: hypothetical protein H8E62_04230 [Planctomycetes bacterium]|nr:hypothetical protein [Planctomycetota bacterium]